MSEVLVAAGDRLDAGTYWSVTECAWVRQPSVAVPRQRPEQPATSADPREPASA